MVHKDHSQALQEHQGPQDEKDFADDNKYIHRLHKDALEDLRVTKDRPDRRIPELWLVRTSSSLGLHPSKWE